MLLYESEMMLNSKELREEWWLPNAGKARRKGHVQRTGEESAAALVSCLSCVTESLPETTERVHRAQSMALHLMAMGLDNGKFSPPIRQEQRTEQTWVLV